MKTEKATKTRVEMGKETDKKLIEYLKNNPDETIYEIAKALGWSTGKVQKALKRLNNKVDVTQEVEGGRLKKKYQIKE